MKLLMASSAGSGPPQRRAGPGGPARTFGCEPSRSQIAPQRRAGPGVPASRARRAVRAGPADASTKGWPRRASEEPQPQPPPSPRVDGLNEGLAPEGQRVEVEVGLLIGQVDASTKGWPRRASEPKASRVVSTSPRLPQRRAGPGGPASVARLVAGRPRHRASTKGWPQSASETSAGIVCSKWITTPQRRAGPRGPASPQSCPARRCARSRLNEGLAPEGQRGSQVWSLPQLRP